MRVVLRSQGIAPGLLDLITKLQSAHDDEARDIQKYRMLAFEALNAIKGPLGMAVNGELSAISAQENSHREMLSTIINALQEYRRQRIAMQDGENDMKTCFKDGWEALHNISNVMSYLDTLGKEVPTFTNESIR